MKQKKGISLIVLVVTIIVMIIVAGAVIISLSTTNVMDMAEKGEKEWNISTIKEQLTVLKANKLLENNTSGSMGEGLYGNFSKYGIDIGNLEDKLLIEDGTLVYAPENVTEQEAKYFESEGITKARHYVIVSEETKSAKYSDTINVGTYANFVTAVNAGEFTPNEDGTVKYVIAYLAEDIDLGNHQLEDGTWVDKNGNVPTSLTTINTFDGILDGQGHTISGIYVFGPGIIKTNNGTIKDISINGRYIWSIQESAVIRNK